MDELTALADRPVLLFSIHEDGTIEHIGPWFPYLAVSDAILALADGRRIVLGDGMLTFRCTNGGARYLLSGSTSPGMQCGRLVESWA